MERWMNNKLLGIVLMITLKTLFKNRHFVIETLIYIRQTDKWMNRRKDKQVDRDSYRKANEQTVTHYNNHYIKNNT